MVRAPLDSALFRTLAAAALCGAVAPAQSRAPGGEPRFVANTGHWPAEVRFAVLGASTSAWVHDDGWTLRFERRSAEATPERATPRPAGRARDPERAGGAVEGAVVRLRVRGAAATVAGDAPSPVTFHFHGPRGSHTAPAFGRLVLHELAPGVDVVLRADAEGGHGPFAYDLHVAAGADLGALVLEYEGATALELAPDGALRACVPFPGGEAFELTQRPPVAWYAGEPHRPVAVHFRVLGERTFGFEAPERESGEALIVDPGFVWSTHLGGGSSDAAYAVGPSADGSGVLVAGFAGSTDFPTTPGSYRAHGRSDGFVALLDGDGRQMRWGTYIGGTAGEEIRALDVGPDGTVVVGGWTGSDDFPVTPGVFQDVYAGGSPFKDIGDAFVARLSGDGARLVWSTYLGRFGDDFVRGVHVDASNAVTVVGETDSDGFPTTPGAFQERFGSSTVLVTDAFATRFTPDGRALVWSTYLGGEAMETVEGFDVAPDGSLLLAGMTGSPSFPLTPGAFRTEIGGLWEGYIARLSGDGARLVAATLFGGDGFDQARGVTLGPLGDVWVTGVTSDDPFPIVGEAWQPTSGGGEDAWVARFSGDLTTLRASSHFGGSGDEMGEDIAFDAEGALFLTGWTSSADLPVGAGAPQRAFGGGTRDAFVASLDPTLGMVRALTFLGGSERDSPWRLQPLGGGHVLVVGSTFSGDFPVTAGAFQPAHGGGGDAFVARVDVTDDRTARLLWSVRPSADLRVFEPGARFVGLAGELSNRTGETVRLTAFDLVVAGSGRARRDLQSVAVHRDVGRDGELDPGDPQLAGPIPFDHDGVVVRAELPAVELAHGETLPIVVALTARQDCAPGAEFVTSSGGAASFVARRGDGRRVFVDGPDTPGPLHVCRERSAYSGDLDGDGRVTVLDVRRLVTRLGEAAPAGHDADGDGVVQVADVQVALARAVGRPALLETPAVIGAGGALGLGGFGLDASVTATLAGLPLPRIAGDARTVVFRVPVEVPPGREVLRVRAGRSLLLESEVEIR